VCALQLRLLTPVVSVIVSSSLPHNCCTPTPPPLPPEHFVHPDRKAHPKFASVSGLRFNLFPAANQVGDGKIITPTLGEAVASGLINNETLAYFVGRTALFLQRVRRRHGVG
jgi:hypothetical protein